MSHTCSRFYYSPHPESPHHICPNEGENFTTQSPRRELHHPTSTERTSPPNLHGENFTTQPPWRELHHPISTERCRSVFCSVLHIVAFDFGLLLYIFKRLKKRSPVNILVVTYSSKRNQSFSHSKHSDFKVYLWALPFS